MTDTNYQPGAAAELDRLLTERLKRTTRVEQILLDAAAGRRPMLTQDECRTLALALGTPEEAQTAEQRALLRSDSAEDRIEYLKKGVAEWRDLYQTTNQQARAARATAQVAIGHLQAVLNQARTHDEQQRADTAARDWLISIGSEPGETST